MSNVQKNCNNQPLKLAELDGRAASGGARQDPFNLSESPIIKSAKATCVAAQLTTCSRLAETNSSSVSQFSKG